MPNALAQATSPYLLQHQGQPRRLAGVERGDAGRSRGPRTSRSCSRSATPPATGATSWRTRASRDPGIAALMNQRFINIKVDREERPDLDTVYQQALAVMGQQGGWPLTMFLTPDGEPFWGGTYFPPEPRYGRPGFAQVLRQVAELWRQRQRAARSNRDALAAGLRRLSCAASPASLPTPAWPSEVARRLGEQFDTIHGGLGGAPKFPQAPILRLIWEDALRTGDARCARTRLHTLARISPGRHLRPSGRRLRPLLGRRLLARAALREDALRQRPAPGAAGLRLGRDRRAAVRRRAEETVDWLRREMMVEGAFASLARRRQRGRGGPVLRLGRRRSTGCSGRTRPPSASPTA